jgi:pimeloyl-ACP methyl ester carboxylesterase
MTRRITSYSGRVPRAPRSSLALLVVLALLLSGCGVFTSGDDTKTLPKATLTPSPLGSTGPDTTATAKPQLDRFYEQKLAWKPCRKVFRCATLKVPLDYNDPEGRVISVALLKIPAASPSRRIGSLVVDPGGPGASGVDYAASGQASFGPELLQVFDLVGFDPRGVGRSTPLHCADTQTLDALNSSDPDPDTPAETRYSDGLLRKIGKGCLDRSGDLARHMSTEEVAQDLDVLRAALGDRKLSYFGASYGTSIGSTYAGLFPQRVGRIVLDGALDPALSTVEQGQVQAKAFETALRAYVGACVAQGNCFLGDSVDAGTRRIREFLDSVEKRPIRGDGPRQLEAGNALLGIWFPLYSKRYWGVLDQALRQAFAGNGSVLLALSDAYVGRGNDGYEDNSLEALYAVNCLDHDDGIPSSKVGSYTARFEKVSPTFGAVFAYTLSACESWPVHSGRKPAPIRAPGSPPIMVVGTSRDPATPLAWARSLADQLDKGVLVTRDGDGHTGYRAGNACVDKAVESYLVSGVVPKAEVDC